MKYIIKHNKHHMYFNKQFDNQYHFVERVEEAHIFQSKKEANEIYKKFKHKDMFSIEKVADNGKGE